MLVKDRFAVREVLEWTRWEIAGFLLYFALFVALYAGFDLTYLQLPWTPIALIGTAVAFLISFQNNAAYGRIWEARKIWGGIVNSSRTWGMKVRDMVTNEYAEEKCSEEELGEHRLVLLRRQLAWLTALRYAMRTLKSWETNAKHKTNNEWHEKVSVPEWHGSVSEDLKGYLSEDELNWVSEKKNKAAAVLYLQSAHLRRLKEKGLLWEFSFLELENLLQEFFTLQGKSERIKNFPYPRQYATISHQFVWIFLALLPFGIVPEFAKVAGALGSGFPLDTDVFVWISVPFGAAVSWVFHTMLRVGTTGENPFEGNVNDVPISTISRGIEIDLLQLYDQDSETIPEPLLVDHHVQM